MKKILLSASALLFAFAVQAQCEAVTTLNEDFSDFTMATSNAFPQNCWTTLGSGAQGPWLYTAENTEEDNQYAVYYTHFAGANVSGYFVSPELSTIDGNHQLTFDVFKLAQNGEVPEGIITVQAGTLSDPADVTTFTPAGALITIQGAEAQQSPIIVIEASETQKYIAFKFTANSTFNAAGLDNVVWQEVTAGLNNSTLNTFSLYPNPTTSGNITIAYNSTEKGNVAVYALTGAKVFEAELKSTTQQVDLTSLSSGVYVVTVQNSTGVSTQKLVIQ